MTLHYIWGLVVNVVLDKGFMIKLVTYIAVCYLVNNRIAYIIPPADALGRFKIAYCSSWAWYVFERRSLTQVWGNKEYIILIVCTLECRYNAVQFIMISHTTPPCQQQNVDQTSNSQQIPLHLTITGELWCVYCDDFGVNWPCYNGTALYLKVSCFAWRMWRYSFMCNMKYIIITERNERVIMIWRCVVTIKLSVW